MKLETVYDILKNANLEEFYIPQHEYKFIFREDVNLTIVENKDKEETDRFGFDYFHNENKEPNNDVLETPDDKLVYDAIQIKADAQTYAKGTSIVTWEVKYASNVICELEFIKVRNESSLHILLPLKVEIQDYKYNFIRLWNESNSPNASFKLEDRIDIIETTIKDF